MYHKNHKSRSVLIPLGLTTAADAAIQKTFGSDMTILKK